MTRVAFLSVPAALLVAVAAVGQSPADKPAPPLDFNRDVRPILFNNCVACHGPDEKERKAGLRLDTRDGATADGAVVPGKPDASELVKRLLSTDPAEVMPPPKSGKKLTAKEIATLKEWVRQGANYSVHWAYAKPVRPAAPKVSDPAWVRNPVDAFVLARLDSEGLKPSPEADRYALARRVALDLTGLPPTVAEADEFAKDPSPGAYERFVDRQLAKPGFGEHWARMWLDLARYADSAGYADDPPRTIWAYRDYVIRSFNDNKPFDRFTIEQLAGDLLPDPTEEQLTATAFHRNTLTNNEGGTSDEEFRNVAVVDRVNTTMAVWMGTSMACAQCHTHKYDPITQAEYFRFFAFLNNTEDADRGDESPLLPLFTDAQKKRRAEVEAEIAALREKLKAPPRTLLAGLPAWEAAFPKAVRWETPKPTVAVKSKTAAEVADDGTVTAKSPGKKDSYTVELPVPGGKLSAVRVETFPANGKAVAVAGVTAAVAGPGKAAPAGRFVRIELPGKAKTLSLAEVEVFSGGVNVARKGTAKQSTTGFGGDAKRAIDGNTSGDYFGANSTTHNNINDDDAWWEVDLTAAVPVDRVVVWNRTDGGPAISARLSDFRVAVLDEKRSPVWEKFVKEFPNPQSAFDLGPGRAVPFGTVIADVPQPGFDPASLVVVPNPARKKDDPHAVTLVPLAPADLPTGGKIVVTVHRDGPAGTDRFRVGFTAAPGAAVAARTPADVVAIIGSPSEKRTDVQRKRLEDFYLSIAPELKANRDRLAVVEKELAGLKPATTVPIFRELPKDRRRVTKLQFRGNFLDTGDVHTEGTPAAFHPLPKDAPLNRLGLAQWLVSAENPLTARVVANRFWEQLFGTGLVRTSEEFGAQGELPTHPELLDWLATELVRDGWDVKKFLKLLVTSATYRQTSKVAAGLAERDPDNRLLARGPRFRLSAETVRDQALAASGLLSAKMYGPSVKPPQPAFGLSAAFGRSMDWQTSTGDDKYRRGLYTEWRRTNPYPSMAAFDAPSREACTIRRLRSNTPLQALVTLNDPVYVEAAQAVARKVLETPGTPADRATAAFRLCLVRPPSDREVSRLVALYTDAKATYAADPAKAAKLATDPLGPLPKGIDATEAAAWTVVGNVLLNLDEMFLKR